MHVPIEDQYTLIKQSVTLIEQPSKSFSWHHSNLFCEHLGSSKFNTEENWTSLIDRVYDFSDFVLCLGWLLHHKLFELLLICEDLLHYVVIK